MISLDQCMVADGRQKSTKSCEFRGPAGRRVVTAIENPRPSCGAQGQCQSYCGLRFLNYVPVRPPAGPRKYTFYTARPFTVDCIQSYSYRSDIDDTRTRHIFSISRSAQSRAPSVGVKCILRSICSTGRTLPTAWMAAPRACRDHQAIPAVAHLVQWVNRGHCTSVCHRAAGGSQGLEHEEARLGWPLNPLGASILAQSRRRAPFETSHTAARPVAPHATAVGR